MPVAVAIRTTSAGRNAKRPQVTTPGISLMRRSTVTINYGTELPLAQGIKIGDD